MKMASKSTTIRVSPEVWKEVNTRKELGDTVDDVLRRALNMPDKEA